jgi:hypothetical protein
MRKTCKYKIFITTILLSLFIFSCNSNNDSSNINNPETHVDFSGHISSTDGPVEFALVLLDSLTILSDSNGFFCFTNCIKKTSKLSVVHPEFMKWSFMVQVTDSYNYNVVLKRSCYDYFPLKVGNYWQYYMTDYGNYPPPNDTSWFKTAKIEWEIISRSGIYPDFIFRVKENYFDSTSGKNTEGYFNIQTSNSDSIKFLGTNKIFENTSLKRYYSVDSKDIVEIYILEDSIFYLKRNIGLDKFRYDATGIMYGRLIIFSLIKYNLK